MTNKLTRERIDQYANDPRMCNINDEIREMARMALAAMDNEPNRNPVLAYADSYRDMAKQGVESVQIWSVITDLERNIAPLYRHAQPAPVVLDENSYTETQKKVLLEAANVLVTRKPTVTHGYLIREVGRIAVRALARPQPAPVGLANIALPHSWFDGEGVEVMSADEVKRACRAAMLNGGKS